MIILLVLLLIHPDVMRNELAGWPCLMPVTEPTETLPSEEVFNLTVSKCPVLITDIVNWACIFYVALVLWGWCMMSMQSICHDTDNNFVDALKTNDESKVNVHTTINKAEPDQIILFT